MRTKSGWALATAVSLVVVFTGCSSSNGNGTTGSGSGFVWVATPGDQKLTAYSVNLSSGATSRVGTPVATGVQPAAIAITPDGKTLFVANSGDNTIKSYAIGKDGSLTAGSSTSTTTACPLNPPPCPLAPPPPTCGDVPVSLSVDPTGKFLFVAGQGTFDLCNSSSSSAGTISTYTISGSSLTFASAIENQAPIALTGTGPSAVAAAPAGNFIYVANQFTNTVESYSYDSTTGAISLNATYVAGTNPSGLAFSRCAGFTSATTNCPSADGNNLFVANSGSNNVSVFTACIQAAPPACGSANGSLTELASSPFTAGLSPTSLIVNPVANFVYVVDSKSNEISEYQYSPATGTLVPLSSPVISTASTPGAGGITSDGSYLFVPDTGASTMSVYKVDSVSATTGINPTGKLSLPSTSSVSLTAQPAVLLAR